MDVAFQSVVKNANIKTKWRVKYRTLARRRPVDGVQLGYVKDLVFYSNWIKDGWISVTPMKWVVATACEVVNELPPVEPPVMCTDLYRLRTDAELPRNLLKKDRSGVPQTARFIHYGNGSIKYTDDLIAWMLKLNKGMTRKTFENISDSWNRQNEKFRDGERKYPFEIGFAGNIHRVRNRIEWAGGLNINPGTVMLELDSLHPDFLPDPEVLLNDEKYFPYQIMLNMVINTAKGKITGRMPGSLLPRTALISPVVLWIEEARCVPVTEWKPLFE